jgi:hypothetical protein
MSAYCTLTLSAITGFAVAAVIPAAIFMSCAGRLRLALCGRL